MFEINETDILMRRCQLSGTFDKESKILLMTLTVL